MFFSVSSQEYFFILSLFQAHHEVVSINRLALLELPLFHDVVQLRRCFKLHHDQGAAPQP